MEKSASKKFRPLIITLMVALVAVVVGMGGFTFAKYFSSTGAKSNQATVAKWGFVLNANATNLFDDKYKGTGLATTEGTTQNGTVVVAANTEGSNVVAPGTTGSMTFSISGTAEVMSKLTITAESSSDVILKTSGESDYVPLKWTLSKGGQVVDGCQNLTLTAMVAKINELDDQDQQVAPNTQLTCAGDYTLTWEWAFSTDTATDAKDTLLGRSIADTLSDDEETTHDGTTTSVQFSITISIEQIQA